MPAYACSSMQKRVLCGHASTHQAPCDTCARGRTSHKHWPMVYNRIPSNTNSAVKKCGAKYPAEEVFSHPPSRHFRNQSTNLFERSKHSKGRQDDATPAALVPCSSEQLRFSMTTKALEPESHGRIFQRTAESHTNPPVPAVQYVSKDFLAFCFRHLFLLG